MENKEKYYLYVEGKEIEVSKEVYKEYYHYKNKEEYFMKDLKTGRTKTDPLTNEKIYLPSREDSYERIINTYGSVFDSGTEKVEDIIIKREEIAFLYRAINNLSIEDRELIKELFFHDKTETEVAKNRGVSISTVRYHKNRVLKKLKKLM